MPIHYSKLVLLFLFNWLYICILHNSFCSWWCRPVNPGFSVEHNNPQRAADSTTQAHLLYEIWDTQNARDAIGECGNKETRAGGWAGVVEINWHSQCSSVQQVEAVHNQRRSYYEREFDYLFNLYLTRNSRDTLSLERLGQNGKRENACCQFTTRTRSTIKHDLDNVEEIISLLI